MCVCTCEQVVEEQQEAAERGETGGIGSSRIGDVLRASLLVRDARSALVAVSVLKERMNVVRKQHVFPCLRVTNQSYMPVWQIAACTHGYALTSPLRPRSCCSLALENA